eukprot:scaffold187784_cov17-Prasinocladus_malaysianus.AAC.1
MCNTTDTINIFVLLPWFTSLVLGFTTMIAGPVLVRIRSALRRLRRQTRARHIRYSYIDAKPSKVSYGIKFVLSRDDSYQGKFLLENRQEKNFPASSGSIWIS